MARHIERRVPWHVIGFWSGVAMMIAGALFGTVFALQGRTKGLYEENRRDHLQDACVAGNANACRIYEVDYGGGAL